MGLRGNKSGKTRIAILSLIVIAIFAISIFAISVGANTHTSSADLQPEWSKPGVENNYTVTITNNGPDTVDEVRIYRNMQYTNFVCEEKEGWELLFSTVKQACEYTAKDSDYYITAGNFDTFKFSATAPSEDPQECLLQWKFETRDLDEVWHTIYDTTSIDSEPPVTTKIYGDPFYSNGNYDWISTSTPITLTAQDMSIECGIGVNKTYWRNTLLQIDEQSCIAACDYEGSGIWNEVNGNTVTFDKDEESCHLIEFYAVDKLGNVETTKRQCVFVDNTPPVGTKEIGEPKYGGCPKDEQPTLCEGWTGCEVIEENKDFFTTGRADPTNWDLAIKTPPDIIRTQDEFVWDNNQAVDFSLSYDTSDGDVVYTVGDKTLTWTYASGKAFGYIVAFAKGNANGNNVELTNMVLNGKALPDVKSNNGYKGVKVVLSDSQQTNGFTITGKVKFIWTAGHPQEVPGFHIFAMETHEPEDCWVRDPSNGLPGTPIKLTCTDQEPHPSGNEEVCYKVSYDLSPFDLTTQYCGGSLETITDEGYQGDWCCVPSPKEIIFVEDSLHDLEYFCRDAVGKESGIDKEWFRVDSLPPKITKTMIGGDHLGDCPPGPTPQEPCYVKDSGENGVRIDVEDDDTYEGCAVDDVTCTYELWWKTDLDTCVKRFGGTHLYNEQTGQCFVEGGPFDGTGGEDIYFHEDSIHTLKIHCEDALGNSVDDEETFLVDSTPPVTTKTYGDPHFPKEIVEEQYPHWISTDTSITLVSTDEKVGVDETYYRVTLLGSNDACNNWNTCQEQVGSGDFTLYSINPFKIEQESCHLIEYYSVDKLGNVETTKKQCVFVVSDTVPVPNKIIDEPYTEWYPTLPKEIFDPGEGDELGEEDPDATYFYPWIVKGSEEGGPECWNADFSGCEEDDTQCIIDKCKGDPNCLECWKVTTDTKISMECDEEGESPHPVSPEKVCFQVEMDGEDVTDKEGCVHGWCWWNQGYCDKYGGEMNDDGYCCVDHEIEDFKFKEESEHNLKYYCVGGFGSKSDIDEEKFKVIGELFKIKINDKWNLISVPFVLLNDDPEEVFEDTPSVQSVWTYNAEQKQWEVYRPEEDDTSNLDAIVPGEGYWVLADCENSRGCGQYGDNCEMLVVGGSLYNPGPVVPPSQNLEEGWNLIGYYGTDGKHGYYGPNSWYHWFDKRKEAYCELYSLRNLQGGLLNPTKWSALVGYWEPDNPQAWYELGFCDEMDPGAGYWISMDAEGNYKPETVCDKPMLIEVGCSVNNFFS